MQTTQVTESWCVVQLTYVRSHDDKCIFLLYQGTVLPLRDAQCQANQLTHQLSRSLSWQYLVYELATAAILYCKGVRPACVSKGAQSHRSFILRLWNLTVPSRRTFVSYFSIFPHWKGGKKKNKKQLLQQNASCLDSSKSSHALIWYALSH